ncbi:MAG: 2OG-Fe(II) oxygenase [Cyanobacteria bacterium J06600_6]
MVKALPKIKQSGTTPQGFYALKRDRFEIAYLDYLKSAILTSPYLAASQLSENFTGTKGFSVVFKRSGIERVVEAFPEFEAYLDVALKPGCNAFYLNPLVLEAGSDVKPHVDCSISSYEMAIAVPNLVSVLYVQVPEDIQGGELVLEKEEAVKAIPPQYNTLLYFLGNLTHSVKPFSSKQSRISLICEQYNLPPERLEYIPEFEIISQNVSQNISQDLSPTPIVTRKNKLCYEIDNFLTKSACDRLLQLAIAGESDFCSSELQPNHHNPQNQYRNSLVYQPELSSEFTDLFNRRIREVLPDVCQYLDHSFDLAEIEMQLTAHNDGHYFRLHNDNAVGLAVGRAMTFVYYFQRSQAFTGGELRIFDSEEIDSLGAFELVKPQNNKIVFFPSQYLHEVLPINCPTQAFVNSRFTVNGWLWRTSRNQPSTSEAS